MNASMSVTKIVSSTTFSRVAPKLREHGLDVGVRVAELRAHVTRIEYVEVVVRTDLSGEIEVVPHAHSLGVEVLVGSRTEYLLLDCGWHDGLVISGGRKR